MSTFEAAPRLRAVRPGETVPQETGTNPRRSFEVIENRRKLASRLLRFFAGTLLVTVIVGLIGALVLHATIVEAQQNLDERNAEIQALEDKTELLRQELAELAAPARVVSEAKSLGMIEAPSIVYLTAPSEALDERTLSVARHQLEGSG